jgi:hypothetical protein
MELKNLINDKTALPPQDQDEESEHEPQDEPEQKVKKEAHGMKTSGDVNMNWFVNYILTKRISN